jgi:hypothetical protein
MSLQPVCFYATPAKPASDHVAQGAIALALASIVFRAAEPSLSARFLDISQKLYATSKLSLDTAVQSGFDVRLHTAITLDHVHS